MVPGRSAQSVQLLATSPPSICVAAVATPSSIPSSRKPSALAMPAQRTGGWASDATDWRPWVTCRSPITEPPSSGSSATGPSSGSPLDRHAAGRRLAADLVAADDLPRFDASAMDGYAVCPGSPDQRTYAVVGDVPAGAAPGFVLAPGEAARVMTGARVPEGTVAVVPVERTDASPTGPAPQQRHGRRRPDGRAARAPPRRGRDGRIGHRHNGIRRSRRPSSPSDGRPGAPRSRCTCRLASPSSRPAPSWRRRKRPRARAASTSRTPTWSPPSPRRRGAWCVRVEVCSDEPDELRALLDGLDADPDVDLVVTTGGVSAGAYEVVRQVVLAAADLRLRPPRDAARRARRDSAATARRRSSACRAPRSVRSSRSTCSSARRSTDGTGCRRRDPAGRHTAAGRDARAPAASSSSRACSTTTAP